MTQLTITNNPTVVTVTKQGVQGPAGPMGDVTPEAIAARDAAVAAASGAASSKSAAQGYASTATNAANAASQSADAAAASETAAGSSATTASNAATTASNAANTATSAATAASSSASAAAASESAAGASATAASDAASVATTSAGQAKASQDAAAISADAAAGSATSAGTSANAAGQSASEALASRNSASASAQSAQESATTASDAATAAGASASSASASATSAGNSEHTATGAAATATTAASEAAASESAAQGYANTASAAASAAQYAEQIAREVAGVTYNDIGVAGGLAFGVGLCPDLPDGFTPLSGTFDRAAENYGNYRYLDGSVMVWIPAFYYRIGSPESPRYAVHGANAIDILPATAFTSRAAALGQGWALHRAFMDGGAEQPGFFIDKYACSNNAGVASSLALGAPLSTHATHNPIGDLAGAPINNYGGCFAAAKTRGPQFFPAMRYMHTALALLATAHSQAATSDTWCAWYSETGVSAPRGNNNNAFGDVNDSAVSFTSDEFAGGNSALTGSGVPIAKTTHNGQGSGVADLNGNMYEISPGVTYVAANLSVTAWTETAPAQLTVPAHGLATGDIVVGSLSGHEMDGRMWAVTVIDADTLELDTSDGTTWGAYPGGATLVAGTMYALRPEARAADLAGGNSGAADAWGLTGLTAHSAPLEPTWRTDFPENTQARRYGNAGEAVFTGALEGDAWLRDSLGLPLPAGLSNSGTHLYGQDYCHQHVRNELCPFAGLSWSTGSNAGVWGVHWGNARTSSSTLVGFRAASYL